MKSSVGNELNENNWKGTNGDTASISNPQTEKVLASSPPRQQQDSKSQPLPDTTNHNHGDDKFKTPIKSGKIHDENYDDDRTPSKTKTDSTQEENGDDDDDDEQVVRALAAKLAPQVHELEVLLSSPPGIIAADETDNNDEEEETDDEMDVEWKHLAASEQLLREELEFAENVTTMLGSPIQAMMMQNSRDLDGIPPLSLPPLTPEHRKQQTEATVVSDNIPTQPSTVATPSTALSPPPATTAPAARSFYTLSDHAHAMGLQTEPKGGWYYLNRISETVEGKEYVLPLPAEQIQRLYVGVVDTKTAVSSGAVTPRQEDQMLSGGGVESTPTTAATATNSTEPGASSAQRAASPSLQSSSSSSSMILPVRTVVIRIRPDVLCGAVMDAMAHALETLGAELLQRQGGHLRGMVGPCIDATTTNNSSTTGSTEYPPYLVDAQLCTYRGSEVCERSLLLRVYHVSAVDESVGIPASTPLLDPLGEEASAKTLREAAAWVQHMEAEAAVASSHSILSNFFGSSAKSPPPRLLRQGNRAAVQQTVSEHLLRHAKPCKSVAEGVLTLPALSEQDSPIIEASWRWIFECWNELETRDLCYATLQETRFGAFPALPTLDVHFCSQIRRVCRDYMIRSLLKSASELEEYAREAEYACASLIQTLRPAFELYGIDPPALPQPLPLTAYPLDFTPPQVSCPPWGLKVDEALNKVAFMTSEANTKTPAEVSSFQLAEEAVEMVVFAFQRQDDEEQSARLGRKNCQVMDRLAKMQAHKRASIEAIRDAYERSLRANAAAQEFHHKAMMADAACLDASPAQEVPLFKCSVMVRGSTGHCYVTASHILFVTQRIPILGGNTCTLLTLKGLEFVVHETGSSMLNPLPTSISILREGQEVFSFRPSYGASRLLSFLESVQALAENREGLTFSERGGLLYMYGDTMPAKDT